MQDLYECTYNAYLSMNYEIGISESNWGIETWILDGLKCSYPPLCCNIALLNLYSNDNKSKWVGCKCNPLRRALHNGTFQMQMICTDGGYIHSVLGL